MHDAACPSLGHSLLQAPWLQHQGEISGKNQYLYLNLPRSNSKLVPIPRKKGQIITNMVCPFCIFGRKRWYVGYVVEDKIHSWAQFF